VVPLFPHFFFLQRTLSRFPRPPAFHRIFPSRSRNAILVAAASDAFRRASRISLLLSLLPRSRPRLFNPFPFFSRKIHESHPPRSLTVVDVRLHRRYPQILAEILHSCFVQLGLRHRPVRFCDLPRRDSWCLSTDPTPRHLSKPRAVSPCADKADKADKWPRASRTPTAGIDCHSRRRRRRRDPECRRGRNAARGRRRGSPNCRRLPALTSRRRARIEWRGW